MQETTGIQGYMTGHRYVETGGLLTVTFKDGRQWTHSGVTSDLYAALKESDFPMLFWATKIRQATGEGGHKLYPIVRRDGE
jgi:KTSC domain